MRNPRDMRIIEIDITNACVRSCSNCTRFCGHHKKPFYMNVETFKKAIDSLEGYEGIVGMMGGEPTLHPNFKEMTLYMAEKFGKISALNADRLIVNDFPAYLSCKQVANMTINKDGGAGLLTSVTKQYYKHYELIQDTFSFQNLNDHSKASYHQPILITRTEYGIPDDEWIKLRNDCWLQNYWSASITPKGVFFCEVAASLDILFDGEGGFPIEDGWWRRDVSEFESQFHWCEMCGVALKTFDRFKRNANEEIDDISPYMLKRLEKIGSKRVAEGKYELFTHKDDGAPENDSKYGIERYISDASDRFGDSVESLRPHSLSVLDVAGVSRDRLGRFAFSAMEVSEQKDWFLIADKSICECAVTEKEIKQLYLNPGCCFVFNSSENCGEKTQILVNCNASSYKNAGYDGFYNCHSINDIKNLWDSRNIVFLEDDFKKEDYSKDIRRWEIMAQNSILNDFDFKRRLYERISALEIKKGGSIVVIPSASFYLVKGVCLLLQDLGYCLHMFVSEGNSKRYMEIIGAENTHTFSACANYCFETLLPDCDELKKSFKFDGSLMLASVIHESLKENDGFHDVAKIADYLGEKFIGCINLRRKFSEFK